MKYLQQMRYGIEAGVVTVLLLLLAYFVDKKLMLSAGVYWGTLAVYLFAMVRAVEAVRRDLGETAALKQLVRPAFVTYLVANVFFYLFYYGMCNADAGLQEALRLQQQDYLHWAIAQVKEPSQQKQFQDALDQLAGQDMRPRAGETLLNMARGAAFGFVLSFALAWGLLRLRR